jgi:acyl carrier protein
MAAQVELATLRLAIESQIREIALEHGRTLAPLTDELKLLESGMDSLSLATLVMRLAEGLGIDPFNPGSLIEFPATLGDLVRMYEAFGPSSPRSSTARSANGSG